MRASAAWTGRVGVDIEQFVITYLSRGTLSRNAREICRRVVWRTSKSARAFSFSWFTCVDGIGAESDVVERCTRLLGRCCRLKGRSEHGETERRETHVLVLRELLIRPEHAAQVNTPPFSPELRVSGRLGVVDPVLASSTEVVLPIVLAIVFALGYV